MVAKFKNPRLQAQITPELKNITGKMLEHLQMNQAQFFEKYLPTLFFAIDKEKYLNLVEEVYGNKKLEEMIAERDQD
ncbi:hypothetical protein TXYLGN1_17060 [Tepidimicrobium xylanilyticum]